MECKVIYCLVLNIKRLLLTTTNKDKIYAYIFDEQLKKGPTIKEKRIFAGLTPCITMIA